MNAIFQWIRELMFVQRNCYGKDEPSIKFQNINFSYVPSETGTYLNFIPALVLTTIMKRKTQQIMHNIIPPASDIIYGLLPSITGTL